MPDVAFHKDTDTANFSSFSHVKIFISYVREDKSTGTTVGFLTFSLPVSLQTEQKSVCNHIIHLTGAIHLPVKNWW